MGTTALRLNLGPLTAELVHCQDQQPVVGGRIATGHHTLGGLFFPQDTLNAASLERAIEWTEDRIQSVHAQIPVGAELYTTEADLRQLAEVSGVSPSAHMVLHVDAVERTFSRLVLQSMGQSPAQEELPASARFFATVVLAREMMHHLHFPHIHIVDEAAISRLCRS